MLHDQFDFFLRTKYPQDYASMVAKYPDQPIEDLWPEQWACFQHMDETFQELIAENTKLDRERNYYQEKTNTLRFRTQQSKIIIDQHFKLRLGNDETALKAVRNCLQGYGAPMSRIPRESDLKSANAERWAIAVMECKTHNPYCGSDGYCHAGGDCFESVSKTEALEHSVKALTAEVKRLGGDLEAMKTRQTVLNATIESHIQSLSDNYNQTTNENQKWAIHFARQKFLALQKELQGEGNAS